jgi:hypothetical protein
MLCYGKRRELKNGKTLFGTYDDDDLVCTVYCDTGKESNHVPAEERIFVLLQKLYLFLLFKFWVVAAVV